MTALSGPTLGIDPGGRWTGLAVRHGSDCLAHRVITRESDEDLTRGIGVGPVYLAMVLAAVAELHAGHSCGLLAVEGIVKPNAHVRRANGKSLTDPTGILGTAAVWGAILALHPEAVIVPPGANGDRPLAAYPLELVGPRELSRGRNVVGTGILRHARSAYDVAGSAGMHARLRASKRA